MRWLALVLLFVSLQSFSQRAFQRFGIGAQLFEPTGVNLQLFNGHFTDNNSSFATYGVLELGAGVERVFSISKDKMYSGGNWEKGGLRVDLNYLYPLLTVKRPFVIQTYVGAGLQTGNRKYETSEGVESKFTTGANVMVRIEFVTHGIDLGRAVWFFSMYGDIKYHSDFTESFEYVSPVLGVRLRKGR